MKAKEKAQELYTYFHWNKDNILNVFVAKEMAKNRALFCVNEILITINLIESFASREYKKEPLNYWRDVKKEIDLI